ncbi:MAG: hypothetical protein ACKOYK_08520 [Cyanobium sp.]
MTDNVMHQNSRPTFEQRAEALQLLCTGFAQFLGHGGWPIRVLRERPEEIPYDCSRLAIIDASSHPPMISTYWRYPEPGFPVIRGEYQDLETFLRGCFNDEIQRAARRSSITIPGFPPAPGEDFKEVAERYFQALDAESEALQGEIDALIATPELQRLGAIIWG